MSFNWNKSLAELEKVGGFAAIFARSGSPAAKIVTHICLLAKLCIKV